MTEDIKFVIDKCTAIKAQGYGELIIKIHQGKIQTVRESRDFKLN